MLLKIIKKYSIPIVVSVLVILAKPHYGYANDLVTLKAFEGEFFARLVFQWKSPVEYDAIIEQQKLIIIFEKELDAEILNISKLLPSFISSVSLGKNSKIVTLNLKKDLTIQSTVNSSDVIFEFRSVEKIIDANQETFQNKLIEKQKPLNQESTNKNIIKVRVGRHIGFTRVVFDWPSKVTYNVSKLNNDVTIEFDNLATIAFPQRLLDGKVPNILGVTTSSYDQKSAVVFSTFENADYKYFNNNNSVVLDFLVKNNSAEKKSFEKKESLPVNNFVKENKNSQKQIAKSKEKKEATKTSGLEKNVLEKEQKSIAKKQKKNSLFSEKRPGTLNVSVEPKEEGFVATFQWQAETPAAIFERAGFQWVVFEGEGPVKIQPILKELSEEVFSIEKIDIMRGTAIRLLTREGLFPRVSRRGAMWKVEFQTEMLPLARPLLAKRQPDWPTGPRVLIPMENPSRRLAVSDPEVGDDLAVVPILQDGRGRTEDKAFAQFKLLSSAQGIAVERWSDDIRVASGRFGIEISSPNVGLVLSGSRKKEVKVDESLEDSEEEILPTILQFAEWKRETDFSTIDAERRKLELAASSIGDDERIDAYLNIAKLYISYGLAPETLGYLRLAEEIDPSIAENLEFVAIRGAASFLMFRIEDSAKDLLETDFGVDPSIALWRAAVMSEQGKWDESRQEFLLGAIALLDLPVELRVRFQLMSANAALKSGDLAGAELELESIDPDEVKLSDISSGKLILGQARLKTGDRKGGLEILKEVIDERFRPTWAKAQVSYTNALYKDKEIDVKEAIDNLEELLFVWRGGDFELELLNNLNVLYLKDNDYRGAMSSLRSIKTAFKGSEDSILAEKKLESLFRKLYFEGESEKLPPIAALALYNDFSEMTPDGEDGDKVINKLADRLVSVDLLDQAAQLLNYQVSFRLKGIEKARIGSKLAAIHLFNRDPDKCLKVLNDSKFNIIPNELIKERFFLEVRAYFEKEEFDKVLKFLDDNTDSDAYALRAEVFWRQKNWIDAAAEFQKALGSRWESDDNLTLTERNHVMQMTVSLALLDNWSELDKIRKRWGSHMAKTEDAEPFEILTSDPDISSVDFKKVATRIAQINTLDAFMNRYKKN